MNAEIEVRSTAAMAVPSDAIVQFEGKQFVFLGKGSNIFEMIEVASGENNNGYTAVSFPGKNGLENQQFVLSGAYSLLMMWKNKQS